MPTPTAPPNIFHRVLLSIEHLFGYHPDDPNYAAAKAELAEITKDALTADELAQLDKTLKAIEAARIAPAPAVVPKA